LNKNTLYKIAEQLCGKPVDDITVGGSGANSRIYQVRCGRLYFALKFYRSESKSLLSRMEMEFLALKLFENHRIPSTPRIISIDQENNCSLLEWIDGAPIQKFGFSEIETAIQFLNVLHGLRNEKEAHTIPLGTESCLSGSELILQLNARLKLLRIAAKDNEKLFEILEKQYAPAIEEISHWAKSTYDKNGFSFSNDLDRHYQTLSPVDFGFHNMLRKKNDQVVFIDFEYFGWADPVHLLSDTLLHPGMTLTDDLKQHFYQQMLKLYQADHFFKQRLNTLYPLFGLRWCAIMMNQFLPGYTTPYAEGMTQEEKNQLQTEKFIQIQDCIKSILRNYKEIPYEI
jgi:thiamine kinase-like enzyme